MTSLRTSCSILGYGANKKRLFAHYKRTRKLVDQKKSFSVLDISIFNQALYCTIYEYSSADSNLCDSMSQYGLSDCKQGKMVIKLDGKEDIKTIVLKDKV